MPRRPARPRLSPDDADRLVRMARSAAQRLGEVAKHGESKQFVTRSLARTGGSRRVGPGTTQGVRLLRRALEVFGDDLRDHLLRFGFAKVVLMAKVKNAKSLIKAGAIQMADGTEVKLDVISKRQLEAHVRGAQLRRSHRVHRAIGPGHDFSVPADIIRITTSLTSGLKSLLPRQPGAKPRYNVAELKEGEAPRTVAVVLSHVKLLNLVINVYRLLVVELSAPKALARPGRKFIVSSRRSGKIGAGQTARHREFLRALKVLTKSMAEAKTSTSGRKGRRSTRGQPHRPARPS